ncbi:LamG-like jellyroll fold domain-containing protein [Paenibacillus sp. TAB 01]|uniref:LamG-like jellyroll fold domain-containing protein n=1 Tax=Paenibacillus sp. TAB 01 TaxID=3368988 RepID=UPI003753D32F
MLTSSSNHQNAFLMGYFRSGPGQSHKAEQLHYAYSRDGLHWYELNGNRPVWTSSLGQGILRDPFISKGPDGKWHLVFTIRPRGPAIGYAASDDLIHWTEEKALPVMKEIPDTVNSWAPEFAYDPVRNDFLVYWASSTGKDLSNSKHYCARTKDWTTFSQTDLFYDPGFQTIDASLAEHDGKYYMAIKDESHVYEPLKYPHPPMNFLAVSDELAGPYEILPGVQTPDYTEGPEFLWVDSKRKWLLYYDYWAYGKFGVMESADMIHWSGELDEKRIRFPYRARHATMFPVSHQELQRLLEQYALLAQYRTPTYAPVRVAAEEADGFFHEAFSMRSVIMDIKMQSAAGIQVLFDEGDSVNGLALRLRDGYLEGAVCSNGHRCIVTGELVQQTDPAEWIQIAAAYEEGKLCLYVDGRLSGEGSASFALVRAHDSAGGYGGRFGTDAFGDHGGKAAFDGAIKNVRIYSVPLQQEDVSLAAQA